jgi:hypothetical protein
MTKTTILTISTKQYTENYEDPTKSKYKGIQSTTFNYKAIQDWKRETMVSSS